MVRRFDCNNRTWSQRASIVGGTMWARTIAEPMQNEVDESAEFALIKTMGASDAVATGRATCMLHDRTSRRREGRVTPLRESHAVLASFAFGAASEGHGVVALNIHATPGCATGDGSWLAKEFGQAMHPLVPEQPLGPSSAT